MENSRNGVRVRERKAELRRRRMWVNGVFFICRCVILVLLALGLLEMKGKLEDVQGELRRLENLHKIGTEDNGEGGSTAFGETDSSHLADTDAKAASASTLEGDYVSSIAVISVDKPVKRSLVEILQKLEELAEEDSILEKILEKSSAYPEDMLGALANNPEMAGFVAGYLDADRTVTGGLTKTEQEEEFPLLLQWDPRWGYVPYGSSNIGLAGCGPTSLAMVLYYLTRDTTITPDRIADYAMEYGYYVEGAGTAWALMEDVPSQYGVKVSAVNLAESSMKACLDRGEVIICAMRSGDFTSSGHFIVILGYDEEGFIVNDPNCVARSRRRWSYDKIENQINSIWAYSM